MSRILITGAAGFIAGHLVSHLRSQGHEVFGVDNYCHPAKERDDKILYGDVRDGVSLQQIVESYKCDTVYHLAAIVNVDAARDDPYQAVTTNYVGTLNILEICRKKPQITMVHMSTGHVYGSQTEMPISEAAVPNPLDPYSNSKYAAEMLCRAYHKTYGVKVKILRCFNTYGPNQSDDGYGAFIPIFTRRVLEGKPPVIHGDGGQTRDLMHISDAMRAFDIIANCDIYGKPINFGTGRETSVLEVAHQIMELCGRTDLTIQHTEGRPLEIQRMQCNYSLAKTMGFQPIVRLEDGLKVFVTYHRKNRL